MSTIGTGPRAGDGHAARHDPDPAHPVGAAGGADDAAGGKQAARPPRPRRLAWWARVPLLSVPVLVAASGLGWAVAEELRTSELQAGFLSRFARTLTFSVEPGPNPAMLRPEDGPYDRRLGYSLLPRFVESLDAQGLTVERQARASARLDAFVARGGFPVFREKTRAGLTLIDRGGQALFGARFPERVYESFEQVPPVLVETLLFIENRELLDGRYPRRNPAVEWDRLGAALVTQLAQHVDSQVQTAGGSTLATQLEKYRHSPEGRTTGASDKLRQMVSASVRAYLDGADTREARRRLVVAYLSSTPLAARPGFGEVNGVGDGLWAWYGTDFEIANRVLSGPAEDAGAMLLRGLVYKQALSLLLAQRRPSYYLVQDRDALAALTDTYLRLLRAAGVIERELAEVALAVRLNFEERPPLPEDSFLERKAASAVRRHLLSLLKVPSLYTLDRLDLTVETTLDLPTQRRVVDLLRELTDPTKVAGHGLAGTRMLGRGDPAQVIYSVTLYERGADANHVRVQADNLDQPLDLNEGTKLELGSTAKLRTIVTYLEIVAGLHGRYARLSSAELARASAGAGDALTRWVTQHLAGAADRSLPALLDAAMERTYSANPGASFFTAGGVHRFANFNRDHDHRTITLNEAFRHSVNLPFIRLMRDVVEHAIADGAPDFRELLADPTHPARRVYLERFADREGSDFQDGFFRIYRGRGPDETLALLAGRVRRPTPERLAVVFRSVRPEAGPEALAEFLRARLPERKLDPEEAGRLYDRYGIERFSLADRGYLAGIHPLELWLVAHLQTAPETTRAAMLAASAAERQAAYAWLFKTRHKKAQDTRIRVLLEEDAFVRIGAAWRRLGYPFDRLVPSYATAIGSSGDRPAALAELIGIVLNDGVRRPSLRIERLHFAAGTPYETVVARRADPGERVLAPEVAARLRAALADVVENGTAKRVAGVYVGPEGAPLAVGGKTGTGDNRYKRYAPGGRKLESRVINRTATFAFFIGDRFFGVITAHVAGPDAAKYDFTSSLPAQILKVLAPAFQPLIDRHAEPRLVVGAEGGAAGGHNEPATVAGRATAYVDEVAID